MTKRLTRLRRPPGRPRTGDLRIELDDSIMYVSTQSDCAYSPQCSECPVPVCRWDFDGNVQLVSCLFIWDVGRAVDRSELSIREFACQMGTDERVLYRRLEWYRNAKGSLWEMMRPWLSPETSRNPEVERSVKRFESQPMPESVRGLIDKYHKRIRINGINHRSGARPRVGSVS